MGWGPGPLFQVTVGAEIFSSVADMIAWALHCAGIHHQIHYLDDFLILGAPDTSEAGDALAIALWILEYLGIPVAVHKTEGPVCCIIFLGILIDTQAFELRLPREKVARLRALLKTCSAKRACTRRELESLLGHQSHAATVVRPGRTFLRQRHGLVVLLHAELERVLVYATPFHVFLDALGSYGCGAVLDPVGCFQIEWPGGWEDTDISVKEMVSPLGGTPCMLPLG